LNLFQIKDDEIFTARGKIFVIELEENETTEFNPLILEKV